ncbi:MAG: TetR/AcrR family transcriptional regulator [Rubrivivax sp.]|nr:TetR/AcrR family transcriptional regulator [Rubrivivax sp.]
MSPVKTRTPKRPPAQPSPPQPPPERGVKAATFKLLLDTAMEIIRDGHIPSVAEVAVRSKVSRATAYRYFPSRSALVTAVIDSSLGPVRTLSSNLPDGRARVHELFEQTFPRFREFEPQLRAAAQLALEQWAQERAGLLEEVPFRRGHRIRILEHAIAPLKDKLTPMLRQRLHHALSVVYGIEPWVILKDIWGLPEREVQRVAQWMADALIDAALAQSAPPGVAARRTSAKPAGRPAARSAAKPAARPAAKPVARSTPRAALRRSASKSPR